MRHIATGQGGAFIGGPSGPLAIVINLDQFKVRISPPTGFFLYFLLLLLEALLLLQKHLE